MISPLAFAPKVPYDRRFVYAGIADRLIHPVHQIEALWDHWEEPDINWFPGGHVGFFLSRPVHEFLERALRSAGMVTDTEDAQAGSEQSA